MGGKNNLKHALLSASRWAISPFLHANCFSVIVLGQSATRPLIEQTKFWSIGFFYNTDGLENRCYGSTCALCSHQKRVLDKKYICISMYFRSFVFLRLVCVIVGVHGYIQSRYSFHLSSYCFGCVRMSMGPPTAYPLCPSSSTPSIGLYVLPPLLLPPSPDWLHLCAGESKHWTVGRGMCMQQG